MSLHWVVLPSSGSEQQAQEASVKTLFWKPECRENSTCKLLLLVASQHSLYRLCHAAIHHMHDGDFVCSKHLHTSQTCHNSPQLQQQTLLDGRQEQICPNQRVNKVLCLRCLRPRCLRQGRTTEFCEAGAMINWSSRSSDVRMRDMDTLKIETVWLNLYYGGT